MVTRTVVGTEAEVQIVSISATEISTIKVLVGGEFDDNEKLLKAIKKQTETEDIKVLKIIATSKLEKCYGMTEAEFIKLAKELDPSTRKALEAEEKASKATEATETKNNKKGDK